MTSLKQRLRACIPTREKLEANRALAWLVPFFGHPKLWHWSRRGVALGVALGLFFGLLIPIAQIPLAVAGAVLLRANLPIAAASTLITNPITFGPVYYAAWHLGVLVTGKIEGAAAGIGLPLLVGLGISAVVVGTSAYFLVSLIWSWRVMAKRRRGRAEAAA